MLLPEQIGVFLRGGLVEGGVPAGVAAVAELVLLDLNGVCQSRVGLLRMVNLSGQEVDSLQLICRF